MRLVILICCIVFSSSYILAQDTSTSCTENEVSSFEKFLNDSKMSLDLKYDPTDHNLSCELKTYKALSIWITGVLQNGEEKQLLCEEVVRFCNVVPQLGSNDKIYLIKRLELTVCKSGIDFTIDENECSNYFPAN